MYVVNDSMRRSTLGGESSSKKDEADKQGLGLGREAEIAMIICFNSLPSREFMARMHPRLRKVGIAAVAPDFLTGGGIRRPLRLPDIADG